jgi:hypothetical protein
VILQMASIVDGTAGEDGFPVHVTKGAHKNQAVKGAKEKKIERYLRLHRHVRTQGPG